MGGEEAEGAAGEGRDARGGEEEDEQKSRSYHSTVLLGKLSQAVYQATNMEGGGCLLPDDQRISTGRPFAEVIREKHPDT